jgi:hypothetical protein
MFGRLLTAPIIKPQSIWLPDLEKNYETRGNFYGRWPDPVPHGRNASLCSVLQHSKVPYHYSVRKSAISTKHLPVLWPAEVLLRSNTI